MSALTDDRKFQHSKLVRISSKSRDGDSKSKYDFKTSSNDFMLHNIKRIILKSITIPNTMYNVNQYNNKLVYTTPSIDAIVKIVTVEPSQYTAVEFMDALVIQFGLAGVVLNYGIDSKTYKITLTFNTPVSLQGDISTMNDVIGMDESITTANTIIPLPHIVNFAGLLKVYVGSHQMTRGTTMTSSDKSHIKIFTEVPITVPFGGIQHRTIDNMNSLDEATHSTPFNLSNNDITLYDQNLNVIDLNGADVEIVLKVFDR